MRLERAEALASLNTALREAYAQIQQILINQDVHEIESAYEIGGIIRCIRVRGSDSQ